MCKNGTCQGRCFCDFMEKGLVTPQASPSAVLMKAEGGYPVGCLLCGKPCTLNYSCSAHNEVEFWPALNNCITNWRQGSYGRISGFSYENLAGEEGRSGMALECPRIWQGSIDGETWCEMSRETALTYPHSRQLGIYSSTPAKASGPSPEASPPSVRVGQRYRVTRDSEGHQAGEVLTIVSDVESSVRTDKCNHDGGALHGAIYFTRPDEFGRCILLSQPEAPAVKPGEMVVIDETTEFTEEQWKLMEKITAENTGWAGLNDKLRSESPQKTAPNGEKAIGPDPSAIPRCTRCNGIHRSSECPPGWSKTSSVSTPRYDKCRWSSQESPGAWCLVSCGNPVSHPASPYCEKHIAEEMQRRDAAKPKASPKFFHQSHAIIAGGIWSLREQTPKGSP